jgi:alpha-tubulin suppressor-like RCC1 family protein
MDGSYTLTGITVTVDVTPSLVSCPFVTCTFEPVKRTAAAGASGQDFAADCKIKNIITGKVTNKSDGTGLAGVTISASGTGIPLSTTTTVFDGTYSLAGINGTATLTASKADFTFEPIQRSPVSPGASGQDFVATYNPPQPITGKVTNKNGGAGMEGVIIRPSSGIPAVTAPDGTYTLNSISSPVDITPFFPGCTFEPVKRSAVAPGASGQDFVADCDKTIKGKVTNKSDGSGLEGVIISASGTGIPVTTTTTVTDGTYSLAGINGPVTLTPSKPNYSFEPTQRSPVSPGASGQDFVATYNPPQPITGKVTNKNDGTGMEGVLITPSSGTAVTTASDGTYTLNSISSPVDITPSKPYCTFEPTQRSAVAPGASGQDFVATCALQVSAGDSFTCSLTPSNGVKCWGANTYGQLGNESTADSSVPVNVKGLTSGVIQIVTGGAHACALTASRSVKCWGQNTAGQLGNNSTTNSSVPVDVSSLTNSTGTISAGSQHTCANNVNGGVKCWGSNEYGQLGNGSTNNSAIPVDVSGLDIYVRDLSAGGGHTCVITYGQGGLNLKGGGGDPGGAAKCWGKNDYGQLGNGKNMNSLVPVDVNGLTSFVYNVSTGKNHTCSRVLDTTLNKFILKCWGSNEEGQLGIGSSNVPISASGAVEPLITLSAGYLHTCGITLENKAAKCWGSNTFGQLGNNSASNSNVPVNVDGLTSGVSNLSGGASHTCASTSSGIKCWGANDKGQLGNCTTKDSLVPVDVLFTCPSSNYTIRGRITTAYNKAVSGAGVSTGSGTPANTDTNGDYILTLPAGTYAVQAALTGYAMKPKSLSITLPPDVSDKNFTAIDGDVSCRATPDTLDVLYILQYTANQRSASTQCPLADNTLYLAGCDVNLDDICDINDAILILQCKSGIKNSLCP